MTVGQLKRVFNNLDDDVEIFLVTKYSDGCIVEDLISLAASNPDVTDLNDITGLYFYGDSMEEDIYE